MTTVEQVAAVDPAATAAPIPVASRLIGAIAVGVALLSATATFLVLAGMTPIDPVQSVVLTLLAVNAGIGQGSLNDLPIIGQSMVKGVMDHFALRAESSLNHSK